MRIKPPHPSRYYTFGVVRLPENLLCYEMYPSFELAKRNAEHWVNSGFIKSYQIVSLVTDIHQILEG